MENITIAEYPVGGSSLDLDQFRKFLKDPNIDFILMKNLQGFKSAENEGLIALAGSRTFLWRVYLGLIPDQLKNKSNVINCLKMHRESFEKKLLSVKMFRD